MFFKFLNFSPPWAASAARARSAGEVVAVITGPVVVPFPADGAHLASLSPARKRLRRWQRMQQQSGTSATKSFCFIRLFLSRATVDMRLCQSVELKFSTLELRLRRGLEIEAYLGRDSPVAGAAAPAAKTTATATTEAAELRTQRQTLSKRRRRQNWPTGFERLTLLKRFVKLTENCML